MELNFIIADDEEAVVNTFKNLIEELLTQHHFNHSIKLITTKPEQVIQYSEENYENLNVYFLDINFNSDINGVSLARIIRDREPFAYIVFLTAHVELSMLTFKYKLKVFDFLVKPVSFNDIEECIISLEKDFENCFIKKGKETNYYITVKSGYKEHLIATEDIIYIEAFGPKIIIHCEQGSIETYESLKDIEVLLETKGNNFFRSHKSYIINLKHIKRINLKEQEIIMSNNSKCLISRGNKAFFKNYIS